jgi:hypothetical protein
MCGGSGMARRLGGTSEIAPAHRASHRATDFGSDLIGERHPTGVRLRGHPRWARTTHL